MFERSLDLDMPGLGGTGLAERLAAERPGLPVILMSGSIVDFERLPAGIRVLEKPFPRDSLLRTVREAIGT